MIRGIYLKIFLWFCFAITTTTLCVVFLNVVIHARSLGPAWMTGVLNQYARSAVEIYTHGGKSRLVEYLEEIEQSSDMQATLLDPEGRDIAGRGIPPGTEDVLAGARSTGHTVFRIGLRWKGASVVRQAEGNFILVGQVIPYRGLAKWWILRPGVLRIVVTLAAGGLLSLLLARHIAAPIRTLQTVASRIADGDLSVRASPAIAPRNDELTDLARDFDRMADRIQSLLRKQQEMLGDISHELRSPLTRLSVSLELVRRGEAGAVERMQGDLERLDDLIGQILTLTRLETLGNRGSESKVSLRSILESVAEDASFEGQEEGKSVSVSCAGDCSLKGDAALLRSCIENVIRNAIHNTKGNSEVVVLLDGFGDGDSWMARILVSDHGPGVPSEALPRLFEPFYRVSPADRHQTRGTGLALSIAQRIVNLHGGRILARNPEQGGLEMEICLPAESPASSRS